MSPFLLLLTVSAVLTTILAVTSRRPVVSWLAGSIVPPIAFHVLNEMLNGPDSFKYIALVISIGCALLINLVVVAAASAMDSGE